MSRVYLGEAALKRLSGNNTAAEAKQRANRIGLALQENLLPGVGAEEGT